MQDRALRRDRGAVLGAHPALSPEDGELQETQEPEKLFISTSSPSLRPQHSKIHDTQGSVTNSSRAPGGSNVSSLMCRFHGWVPCRFLTGESGASYLTSLSLSSLIHKWGPRVAVIIE